MSGDALLGSNAGPYAAVYLGARADFRQDGGTIKNTGLGDAICSPSVEAKIAISGGLVSSGKRARAILATGSNTAINISAGVLETIGSGADAKPTIGVSGSNSKVTVCGGFVKICAEAAQSTYTPQAAK